MSLEEQAQEREIGGVTYRSHPVEFAAGLKALLRLGRIVSPVLAAAAQGAAGRVDERGRASGGGMPGAYAGILGALPPVLSDAEWDYFSELFGRASWYKAASDGAEERWVPLVKQNQGDHFAGRYLEFMRWMTFNLEVNFRPFFDGMGSADLAGLLSTVMASTSPTPGKPKPGAGSRGGSSRTRT